MKASIVIPVWSERYMARLESACFEFRHRALMPASRALRRAWRALRPPRTA